MSLINRIEDDLKQAMRNKDKFKVSVLRMVRSALKYAEIETRTTLSDDQVIDVLVKEVKQRRESLQEFKNFDRNDLAEKVQAELEILKDYLPEQLSEEEVREIVKEAVAQTGAESKKDMGKVMGAVMPKVKGRADGKLINKLVQEFLA